MCTSHAKMQTPPLDRLYTVFYSARPFKTLYKVVMLGHVQNLICKAPRKQTDDTITSFQFKLYHVEKANTVDPDETAHNEPSHLDLQCLQILLLMCLAIQR